MRIMVFLLCLFFIFPAVAARRSVLPWGFGAGLIVGDPTGFTGKYFFGKLKAVDFALGWNLDSHIHLHCDYVYHFPSIFARQSPVSKRLSAYIPIGGRLYYRERSGGRDSDDNEISLGIRIGGGILYNISAIPLEIFLEIIPTMDFIPATDLNLDIALGARYYF